MEKSQDPSVLWDRGGVPLEARPPLSRARMPAGMTFANACLPLLVCTAPSATSTPGSSRTAPSPGTRQVPVWLTQAGCPQSPFGVSALQGGEAHCALMPPNRRGLAADLLLGKFPVPRPNHGVICATTHPWHGTNPTNPSPSTSHRALSTEEPFQVAAVPEPKGCGLLHPRLSCPPSFPRPRGKKQEQTLLGAGGWSQSPDALGRPQPAACFPGEPRARPRAPSSTTSATPQSL